MTAENARISAHGPDERLSARSAEKAEVGRARSPYWHGMLCAETREEIADRMREVLGDRYFTLVCANSYSEETERYSAIDVYPSQSLTTPIDTKLDPEGWTYIGWATPRLSMGVHTKAGTQSQGRAGRPHKYVHFTFERDEIRIDHYAPAGFRLLWVLSVERHDREDDRG